MKRASVLGLLIGWAAVVTLTMRVTAVPAPRGVDWSRVVQTAERGAEAGPSALPVRYGGGVYDGAAQPPPPRHWEGVETGSSVDVGLPRTVDSLGLPLYPPSSLPTRFYDNTEYDVAPLQLPLSLPHSPPPPSFIQQNARAFPTPQRTPQYSGIAPAQMRMPFAPVQPRVYSPIAPVLLQQRSTAYANANAHADDAEGEGEEQAAEQNDENADENENDSENEDENDNENEDDSDEADEGNDEDSNDSDEAEGSSFAEVRSGQRMNAAASAQSAATSFLLNEQQMRSQSRSRLGAAQQRFLYAQTLAPSPALGMREGMPTFAENPQSVAARGFVPRFSALVRELPHGQPVAPYSAFFEARAALSPNSPYNVRGVVQQSSGLMPVAPGNFGRPMEPVLESLPPPPIVLAV